MNVDCQEFLNLVEETNKICCFDIESMGLKGDYNSVICVSIKQFGKEPYTLKISQVGNDRKVVREAKAELEKYMVWVTYYGKGFDVKMLNTRLLKWGLLPIEQKLHADMYFVLKGATLTGRRSQGHLLSWLRTPEEKMTVSASDWSELPYRLDELLPTMVARCESDTIGLEALYRKTRHIIRDLRR
jgi:uncharacterized protein YprB with RNaseH-like and TPR domain